MSAVPEARRTKRPFDYCRVGRVLRALVVVTACAGPTWGQTAPDRTRPPALGPTPQLDLPAIQKRALSNGLAVWLIESHEVPIAQINIVVRAGAGDDPAGKFGAASLTAAMLDEGAGSRSALEIADAVEFLGANLTTTSSFDSSAVRLNVPVTRLGEALPLLADVILRPTFPAMELDRLRQERITALLQARDDPASIAQMAFARIVFGAMHRYGTGAIARSVRRSRRTSIAGGQIQNEGGRPSRPRSSGTMGSVRRVGLTRCGVPIGNRTRVSALKGPRPDRWTMGTLRKMRCWS